MATAILESDYRLANNAMSVVSSQVQMAIINALAAERERCAQVAEHLNGWGNPPNPELARHIAHVIRGLPPAPVVHAKAPEAGKEQT